MVRSLPANFTVRPEQWLQLYPEAGPSWPSRPYRAERVAALRAEDSAHLGAIGAYVGAIIWLYKGYSKLRTRTVLGSYSRAGPRSIGPH